MRVSEEGQVGKFKEMGIQMNKKNFFSRVSHENESHHHYHPQESLAKGRSHLTLAPLQSLHIFPHSLSILNFNFGVCLPTPLPLFSFLICHLPFIVLLISFHLAWPYLHFELHILRYSKILCHQSVHFETTRISFWFESMHLLNLFI